MSWQFVPQSSFTLPSFESWQEVKAKCLQCKHCVLRLSAAHQYRAEVQTMHCDVHKSRRSCYQSRQKGLGKCGPDATLFEPKEQGHEA